MTFNVGTIQGGTHAGWKVVKQPKVWVCACGEESQKYSCSTCGGRRDG